MRRRPTISKRGERWSAIVDVAPPGSPVREQRRLTGRTKAEVSAQVDALLGEVRDNSYVAPSELTFGQYMLGWLDALELRAHKATTVIAYRRVVTNHLLTQKLGDAPDPRHWPTIARTRLDLLTARQLDDLYAGLLTAGRRDGKEGGLSRRSVRFLASVLGKALKDAARKGLVRTNVALNADPPSEKASQAPETKVWTPEQARRFLSSVAEDPDALLWRFYLATGCRRGEALGLRWSDVDLDAGRVSIAQQYTMVGAVPTMLPVKSDRSRRVVDLDPATIDSLRRHRVQQAEHKLALGEFYDPDELGLVFAKPDGSPHHPKRVSARFKVRVERAGVPMLRLHDLRHTAASIMLASGEQARVVQERLGHSTVAFTLARYQKVLPGAQAEAATRYARLLDGSDG